MRPLSPGKFGDRGKTIGSDAVPTGEDLFDYPSEGGIFAPIGSAQGFEQAKHPGRALKNLPGRSPDPPLIVS
jgi:hypothetical protein